MIIFFRIILQHHCELSPLEIDVPSENPFYDLLHISLVTSCKKRVNLFCRPGLIHWIISDFREKTGTFLFTKGNNSCALELHLRMGIIQIQEQIYSHIFNSLYKIFTSITEKTLHNCNLNNYGYTSTFFVLKHW